MSVKKTVKLKPLATRVKTDPGLLARALKDPGLRSKLPASMLTPAQKAVRVGNQLAVPGGTLTNNQIAQQSQQAADATYGPNAVALQQQRNQDTAGWYQAYQQQLAQHQQNIAAAGNQAVGQIAGLQQGITGLGRADQADQQARAAQLSALTGGQAANTTQTDSNASAVRQALLSAVGGQQAGVNAANNSYADSLSHVVAPGQTLQARLAGQGTLKDLMDKINATKASTKSQLVAGEQKSVADAAAEQARLQEAIEVANLSSTTSRANATTAAKTSKANTATKAAVTIRGQDTSAATAAANRRSAAKRWSETTNKYGVTNGAWADWPQAKRDAYVKAHPTGRSTTKVTSGAGSLTPVQERATASRIDKQVGLLQGFTVAGGKLVSPDKKVQLPDSNAAIISALMSDGLTRDEAHVAVSLYRNKGKLGPDGVKSAHQAGLHVNGRYPTTSGAPSQTANVITQIAKTAQKVTSKKR